MGRIGKNLSIWSKLLIYKTIVVPHLNYCSSILFLFNQTQLQHLQKKQNKAMRIILNCNRYTSINSMLNSLSLLSVQQQIFYNTMLIIYKMKNQLWPNHHLSNIKLIQNVHEYNTRTCNNFYVSTVKTTAAQNNIFHKGLVEYNNLPNIIKNSESLSIFKSKCRQYVLCCMSH